MGIRAKPKVSEPANQAAPATGASELRASGMSGKNDAGSIIESASGSHGEQQQRTRRTAKRGAGSSDDTRGGMGAIERGNAAKHGTENKSLSPAGMGSVDVGGVPNGRTASLRNPALCEAVKAAKVYSASSLIRLCAQSADAGIACEFGVYKGHSLRQIRNYRKPPVFGFDSFEGLPEKWGTGSNIHEKGHFACELPTDLPIGTELVKGWFAETIPAWKQEHPEPVKLIHIDCDLYSSTRDVLRCLNDRIEAGTVLLFDEIIDFAGEWYPNWPEGEWKALNEWIEEFDREVQPIGRTDYQQAAFKVIK